MANALISVMIETEPAVEPEPGQISIDVDEQYEKCGYRHELTDKLYCKEYLDLPGKLARGYSAISPLSNAERKSGTCIILPPFRADS